MAAPPSPSLNPTLVPPPQYDNMEAPSKDQSVTSPAYGNIDEPENNLHHPDNKPRQGPHWLKGDPRWILTSKWTATAPYVVLVLFAMSLAEIIVGVLWLVQSGSTLTLYVRIAFLQNTRSSHLHGQPLDDPMLHLLYNSSSTNVSLTSNALIVKASSSLFAFRVSHFLTPYPLGTSTSLPMPTRQQWLCGSPESSPPFISLLLSSTPYLVQHPPSQRAFSILSAGVGTKGTNMGQGNQFGMRSSFSVGSASLATQYMRRWRGWCGNGWLRGQRTRTGSSWKKAARWIQ